MQISERLNHLRHGKQLSCFSSYPSSGEWFVGTCSMARALAPLAVLSGGGSILLMGVHACGRSGCENLKLMELKARLIRWLVQVPIEPLAARAEALRRQVAGDRFSWARHSCPDTGGDLRRASLIPELMAEGFCEVDWVILVSKPTAGGGELRPSPRLRSNGRSKGGGSSPKSARRKLCALSL